MLRIVLLSTALLFVGCDNTARVNFQSGELTFAINSSELTLPTELRETDGTIRSIPCAGMGQCPSSAQIPVMCDGTSCDPGPVAVTAPVGDPIDIDALRAGLPQPFDRVEAIDIRDISYAVTLNTLTVPINDEQILWAPEGAATGMTPLGTVPGIPAEATPSGTVALDSDGSLRLSDYLVGTSPRVRFFVQTVVDLNPGAPFPEGELQVAVTVAMTASGPIIN